VPELDPRLIKLVRELDEERTRRIKAERKAATLVAQFAALSTRGEAPSRTTPARPDRQAPLPRERLADVGFVFNSYTGRLVAPWPRGTPLTVEEHSCARRA
jgi:hypothetical protein